MTFINFISKELGINWRTAKKYADGDVLPVVSEVKRGGMMYDEAWGDIVLSWLEEDSKLPRKNRRNRLTCFKALKELGFKGSYRTVCNFIQLHKTTQYESKHNAGFDRLEHPPGEAQLDFGTMEVEHNGYFKTVKVLLLTFPYSNAGFAVCMPAENQECLLEGLKQLFVLIGGVPRIIRIDNMTTDVTTPKTKFDDAVLTDDFIKFANHYRFDIQTCNPRSGHEKGNVENKVGYVRNHYFVSTPRMKDFESLNQELHQHMLEDLDRSHYEKMTSIRELFEADVAKLNALPETEYPVFKEVEVKANKYKEITLDGQTLHVNRARNYRFLKGILRWDSYEIVGADGVVIDSGHRPYMDKKRDIIWKDIVCEWRSKLNVLTYSRYFKYLPDILKVHLDVDLRLRYERVNQLYRFLKVYTMSEVESKFYELIGADESSDAYHVNWHSYDKLASISAGGASRC